MGRSGFGWSNWGPFQKKEDNNVVRLLISRHSDPWNIQDKAREKMLETESPMEFSHPTSDTEMVEYIGNKRQGITDGGKMMICIDNFQCKCCNTEIHRDKIL